MAHHVSVDIDHKQLNVFYTKPYRKKEYRGREKPSLEETRDKVNEIAQEFFPVYASSLDSWCCENAHVLLTAGTITSGFLVLLGNTIVSWSTQTFWHNLAQSASLGLITIGGAKSWHSYSQNQKAEEEEKEKMKRDLQIEFTQDQLIFLQECLKTVGVAMRQDFNEFPTAYLELSLSMDTAREGIVPDDLKTKWEKVGELIRCHEEGAEEDFQAINIEAIREFIRERIIPRIHFYSGQLKVRLAKLRSATSLDKKNGELSERKSLLDLSPLRDYKTGSIQGNPEKIDF